MSRIQKIPFCVWISLGGALVSRLRCISKSFTVDPALCDANRLRTHVRDEFVGTPDSRVYCAMLENFALKPPNVEIIYCGNPAAASSVAPP